MFLSIRHKETFREALNTKVINKNTGEEIRFVIWANDATGRYRQCVTDEKGQLIVDYEKGEIKTKIRQGNIELRAVS